MSADIPLAEELNCFFDLFQVNRSALVSQVPSVFHTRTLTAGTPWETWDELNPRKAAGLDWVKLSAPFLC